MRKNKPTRCGKCGGTSKPFTMFANAFTGESYSLCINCMSNRAANDIDDLAELDRLISEHEEAIVGLESIIKEHGEMEISPEMEEFAFTPMSSYKMAQLTLASLKAKRLELLSKDKNEERLQYELDKKIDEEKYEEASSIQKELEKLKANPKKRRGFVKKEKKSGSLFTSNEPAEGRCVRCKENFPKPPGLFHQQDIGDCHDMCLPCCLHEIPKRVTSVKMAEEMIADMERYSNMMDKMSLLGKMMTDEWEEADLENEKNQSKSPSQKVNEMMLEILKIKKEFLIRSGESKSSVEVFTMMEELIDGTFKKGTVPDFVKKREAEINSKPKPKLKKTKEQEKKDAQKNLDKAIAWLNQDKEKAKKCVKCGKHPAKLPAIFEDYDLGEIEDWCWLCNPRQLAMLPKTVDQTVKMLDEMNGISKILDELVVLQDLHDNGEMDKAKDINVENMDVEVKLAEQMIARRVIEILEQRYHFLEGIGEDNSLISAADLFVKLISKNSSQDPNHMDSILDAVEKALDEEE